MPDDPDITAPPGDNRQIPSEVDALASLMDGSVTMDELPDEVLGRLLRDLGPDELLQVVGTSPKLFPAAQAQTTANSRLDAGQEIRLSNRRPALLLAAASILIAAGAGIAYYRGSRPEPATTSRVAAAPSGPSSGAATPPAATVAAAPEILTAHAGPFNDTRPPEFRGVSTDGREPRTDGSVVAVEEERITVDLGALDGIQKGARLDLFRNLAPAGTLTIERVFRERASGVSSTVAVQAGDLVRVPVAIQVAALLSAASDRLAAGDRAAARGLTDRAVKRAGTESGTAPVRVRALAQLATLDREAGDVDAALADLRAAVREVDGGATVPPNEAAETRNELGALLLGRQQAQEAVPILRRAHEQATGATAVRVANNLAAALALTGDRAEAERHYREALDRAAGTTALDRERRVIERNLEGLSQMR